MHLYSFDLAWSDDDRGYIATCPEFPGLSAFGETAEEALSEAKVALRLMIATYQDDDRPLPPPRKRVSHSGQFRVRLPRSLHQRAAETAEREGASLNQFVLSAIAEKVGEAARPRAESVDAAHVNPHTSKQRRRKSDKAA